MPTKFRIHELELPASAAGQRFDAALAAALPQYSRARLQRWIGTGDVLLAGRAVLPRQRIAGGEQVRVRAEFTADTAVAPEPIALRIVYEDEALLVIDKPAGLVVHPGAGNPAAFNRYMYVRGNPLGMVDPSGHAEQSPDGGGTNCQTQVFGCGNREFSG